MRHTVDDFLTATRLRALFPAAQTDPTFTDTNLLTIGTEELLLEVVPAIRKERAYFFETAKTFTLSGATNGFKIPGRAVGSVLSKIFFLDANGGAVEEVPLLPQSPDGNRGCYIENNKLYLTPFPASSAVTSLKIIYYLRPGDLIKTSDARQIVSKTSTSISFATTHPTVSTGELFDVIDNESPFVYKAIDLSGTVTGAGLETLSGLSSTSDFAVGDWVAQAGESPIPQIPYDFHPILSARTAARALAAYGDRAGRAVELESALSMESKLMSSIAQRIDQQPQVIVSRFPFRSGGWVGRRGAL